MKAFFTRHYTDIVFTLSCAGLLAIAYCALMPNVPQRVAHAQTVEQSSIPLSGIPAAAP